MAILDDTQLRSFRELAESLGMDALVEVHDAAELERAEPVRMVEDLAEREALFPEAAARADVVRLDRLGALEKDIAH